MITNEMVNLKVTHYKGLSGDRIDSDICLNIQAISYIEKQDNAYVIRLIGDGTLYFVIEDESIAKVKAIIKDRSM